MNNIFKTLAELFLPAKETKKPIDWSFNRTIKSPIDWDFIRTLEGFELKGYVPQDRDVHDRVPSGVTIACGFDLGQHNLDDLIKMKLPGDLFNKLKIYAGVTGDTAKALIKNKPLELSKDECVLLDEAVKKMKSEAVIKEYNDNSKFKFHSIPGACQTVIMSVAFQYGSLKKKTPNFFKSVTDGNWVKAHEQLLNFGDSYKQRRIKEAAYLKKIL